MLAQEFQRRFKSQYNYFPYTIKKVRDGKWWVHFKNFAYGSKLPNGFEKVFIDKLFDSLADKDDKIYPFVLSQKIAKDVEKSFGDVQIEETESLTENDYIISTLKKASLWAKQNGICDNKLGSFLSNPTCMLKASRGEFYKPLFLFCSDFVNKYGGPSKEEQLKKNSIRAFHVDVYDALRQSLMNKFVD